MERLKYFDWEFLYNPSLNRFLALSNKTPLVRYIELPETPRSLKITLPLRILVMISSPNDYETLDVEREWQSLNQALHALIAEQSVSLERLDQATLGALRQKLRQRRTGSSCSKTTSDVDAARAGNISPLCSPIMTHSGSSS